MGGKGSGSKPREYPAHIVDLARRLYASGMTVREIQEVFPKGYRVQTVIERYIPERRPMAKRDQRGEKNTSWKGDGVTYGAVHVRLASTNGPASSHRCADCERRAADWSYSGGCPSERRDPDTGCAYSTDLSRYVPRCRSCHTAHDRTRTTRGQFTARKQVASDV